MSDLFSFQQEVTHDVHYENYRSQKLASKGASAASVGASSVSSSTVSSSEDSQSDKDRALREKEAELKRMQVRTVRSFQLCDTWVPTMLKVTAPCSQYELNSAKSSVSP